VASKTVRVRDLMTRKVTTLDRNDTLDMADEVMELGRIRHLAVLDEGKLVGIVSERDLFRFALAFALGYGSKARKTLLRTVVVKEVMSEPAITIEPDAGVRDAAALMLEKKIGCLPVVDEGKLVGILSESDVLKHVAGR
jgi:CBS domain-containing protein